MSRSLNSGRKTTSNPKLKQPHNAKNCIGFQTFLKSRIDHSIINQSGTNIKKKVTRTEACEAQDQNNLELQLLADSELRLKHRNLKSRTEEQEKNALRLSSICENESTSRQNVLISSSQPIEPIYVCNRNSLQESGNTIYTLDSLEKKVQQLLQLKLMRKSQLKSFASFRMYEDELQKDLQGLINQLQQYSTSTDQGNNCDIDYDIRQIAQKIGILQRIIAESFTESQILKKYYFMKKMSRKSFQIFENKIRKSHGQEAAPAISRLVSSIPQHPSLHFSTISKSSYTKPNRDAYRKSQRSAKKILMRRQNLCRSNYQSQFFNYGPLPVYPKMKQQTTTLSAMKILDQKGSLYQSQFTEKKAEVIDSKSLDCRRDKFIPTKIMFMPKSLLNQKQNNEDRPKKISKIKHKMIYEELSNSKPGNSSYSSFYKQPSLMMSSGWFGGTKKSTEYTSNFIGEKSIMECLAKQANLSNLKYEFKKNVRA